MRLRQATVALLWRAGGRGRSRSFVLRGRRAHFHLLMLHCLGRQRRGAYGQAGRAEVATAADVRRRSGRALARRGERDVARAGVGPGSLGRA